MSVDGGGSPLDDATRETGPSGADVPGADAHGAGPYGASPLARAATEIPPSGLATALAAVLERQAEDAASARAHLRELIRAVDGLAQSHEYLGTALRTERRRGRLLAVAAVALPIAVGAAGWFLWTEARETDRRLDDLRGALDTEVHSMRDRHAAERETTLRRGFEERVARLESDAAAARADLDASRRALGDERTDRAARERDATERLARAERDLAELSGYRAEVKSLRDALGAERSRSDALARTLTEASRPAPEARPEPKKEAAPDRREPPAAATPAKPVPPVESAASRAASKAPEDVERIRGVLNTLLDGTTGAAKYRIEELSGVSGFELLGLRMVASDETGRVLRTIEAPRAEIAVGSAGDVRWRFSEGHLVVAGRRAPFFDGTYTLSLESKLASWRDSGLTCVRLP